MATSHTFQELYRFKQTHKFEKTEATYIAVKYTNPSGLSTYHLFTDVMLLAYKTGSMEEQHKNRLKSFLYWKGGRYGMNMDTPDMSEEDKNMAQVFIDDVYSKFHNHFNLTIVDTPKWATIPKCIISCYDTQFAVSVYFLSTLRNRVYNMMFNQSTDDEHLYSYKFCTNIDIIKFLKVC